MFGLEVESIVQAGESVRILMTLQDLHGQALSAASAGTRFGMSHLHDIKSPEKVGGKAWRYGLSLVRRPLAGAGPRSFDRSDATEAKEWIPAKP